MNLTYTPAHPVAARFHQSDSFARWLMGPIGCTKSFTTVWETFIRAARQTPSASGVRRSSCLFVRNTRQMLMDTVLPIYKQTFTEGRIGNWRASDATYQIRVGDVELDVLLRPLEDDTDVRRVLSINATYCAADEWREIPVSTLIQVAARAGRFPAKNEEGCTYAGIFGASNPPPEDSDWYQVLEVERPEGWELFRFPSARSPEATWRKFLRDTYYEDLMQGATDDYIRVMIDGEYGRSMLGRAVYEASFLPHYHVAAERIDPVLSPNHPIVVGIDFGRTPAAIFGQRTPRGRVVVTDELYRENVGLEKFIEENIKPLLVARYAGHRIIFVGDPAGWARSQLSEKNVEDVFRAAGLRAVKAPTNETDKRIQAVERTFMRQVDGQAYHLISPHCTLLARALGGGYRYKRKRDGTHEVQPDKNPSSHPADAHQYFCLGLDLNSGEEFEGRRTVQVASAAGWT